MGAVIIPFMEKEPSDLIEIAEATRILRVAKSSVYNAIRSGRLRAWKREWDGRMRVRRSEVERLARFRRVGADELAQENAG